MSSGFAKNFQEYARRCLELSRHADTETRTMLLMMARDYMRAAMEGLRPVRVGQDPEPQPVRIR
jgi:hypothetical protein